MDIPCPNISEDLQSDTVTNSTLEGYTLQEFSTPIYLLTLMTVLYGTAFIFGVSGNVIAVIVLIKHRSLFETTAPTLLNLAVADLLVLLLAQPTAVSEFFTQEVWYLGRALCKTIPLLENAAANASLMTILFISVERYFAICHPLKMTSERVRGKTGHFMFSVWIVAFAVSSPLLVITQYKMSRFYDGRLVPVCRSTVAEIWKQGYIISLLCVFYLLPAIVFVFLYSAVIKRLMLDSSRLVLVEKETEASRNLECNRQQVVRLMIFLIVIFFACVLPFRIVSIWFIYAPKTTVRGLGVEGYLWLTHLPRYLVYLNSAINPIVYNLISKRFRKAFFETLACRRSNGLANSRRFAGRGEQFKLLPQASVISGNNSVRTSSIHITFP